MRTKWYKSLLMRYMMILLTAIMLWPLLIPLSSLLYSLPFVSGQDEPTSPYQSRTYMTERWHREATALKDAKASQISSKLLDLKNEFPEASMFWVDGNGTSRLELPFQSSIPDHWTASDTVAFMKKSFDADPFTVVAFIGKETESDVTTQGFMVVQVPVHLLKETNVPVYVAHVFIVMLLILLGFFIFISTWFFFRLRRRLVKLEKAMIPGKDRGGIPKPVSISREDEIGRLEYAFNGMVTELAAGRAREAEEEKLRRELIANLSHDLRTPLTVLRSHAYSLEKENLSAGGRDSLRLLNAKAEDVGRLLDDLLSYTLLAAGKYPVQLERLDMGRLLRTHAAEWYPLLEQNGMELDLDTPEYPIFWQVDANLMGRVLDNLLQNAVRHAADGRYIGIRLIALGKGAGAKEEEIVEICDHGPGMESRSERGGAGLGLAIVELMLREMGLVSETVSSPDGTMIRIRPTREAR
ncbi:sensor histidine kinase [Gorillibacterium timonense]|uniref:sensor histidine kinase n=1 Tax=Gorillibacterium timonense TaxID=1689269 RepID=UPI00071CECA6|nr:HAMP domain-containing sensor histidine kinase [Gorillibacterium timonense]